MKCEQLYEDDHGSRVGRAAAIVEVLGGFGDKGKINGVPIAPIIGGVLGIAFGLAITAGCCVCCFTSIIPYLKGRPLRSPKVYTHGSIAMGSYLSNLIFIPGIFASYHYISRNYSGPYYMTLGFYPGADNIVYGKGIDDEGTYVITGTYSPRTLRMSLIKHYQVGTGNSQENLGHKAIIQVKWIHSNQQFEGKHYVRTRLGQNENRFIIRYEGI